MQSVSLNALGNDTAGHDDYYLPLGVTNDFMLVSPPLNLGAFTTPRIVFDESLGYSNYLANHPASLGDGVSTIEISTDGGLTWAVVWNETRTINFPYYGITVPLAPYAGASNLQLAYHYFGTGAHSWVVDNVVVDNGVQTPILSISGTCPGQATLTGKNMTPGGMVYIAFAYGPGTYTIPAGPCVGVVVPLANPVHRTSRRADQGGLITVNGFLPPSACGQVLLIGFDVVSCTMTNIIPV